MAQERNPSVLADHTPMRKEKGLRKVEEISSVFRMSPERMCRFLESGCSKEGEK